MLILRAKELIQLLIEVVKAQVEFRGQFSVEFLRNRRWWRMCRRFLVAGYGIEPDQKSGEVRKDIQKTPEIDQLLNMFLQQSVVKHKESGVKA